MEGFRPTTNEESQKRLSVPSGGATDSSLNQDLVIVRIQPRIQVGIPKGFFNADFLTSLRRESSELQKHLPKNDGLRLLLLPLDHAYWRWRDGLEHWEMRIGVEDPDFPILPRDLPMGIHEIIPPPESGGIAVSHLIELVQKRMKEKVQKGETPLETSPMAKGTDLQSRFNHYLNQLYGADSKQKALKATAIGLKGTSFSQLVLLQIKPNSCKALRIQTETATTVQQEKFPPTEPLRNLIRGAFDGSDAFQLVDFHLLQALYPGPWIHRELFHEAAIVPLFQKGSLDIALLAFRSDFLPLEERESLRFRETIHPLNLVIERILFHEEIAKSNRLWENTFNAFSEPITVISSDFTLIKVNEAARKLSPGKKILGTKCFKTLAGRKRPCPRCPLFKTKGVPDPEQSVWKDHPSGKQYRGFSYSIPRGAPSGGDAFVVFYQDRSTAMNAFMGSAQKEKIHTFSKLANVLNHEMNNPLTGIHSMIQAMKSDLQKLPKEMGNDLQEDFREIEESSRRCMGILRDFLGFSGEMETKETFTWKEVLEKTLPLLKSSLKQIQLSGYDKLPSKPLTGSFSQMQQVLFNLILNASQAMEGEGKIHFRQKRHGKDWDILTIEDNGPGIPPHLLKRIFDPFVSTKKDKGTGLGLSISQKIMNHHQGEIRCRSQPGKGTAFECRMPI